ncbi:MAG: hypothetical protein JWQ10_1161 [Herbaspirillum sp.]|nr:hypothetical protein [Herbaspirillum sp.]
MAVSGISQTIDTSGATYKVNAPVVPPVTMSPVDKADAGSIASAINLGDMSSIVSTLGQGYSGALTYNAAGLLNSMATAGQAASAVPAIPAIGANVLLYSQDLTDLTVVSTLPSSPSNSGIYTPSGSLQSLPSFAANDSFNSNIVNTLA